MLAIRTGRVVLCLLGLLLVFGCGTPTRTPSAPATATGSAAPLGRPTVPPLDLAALEPGLEWGKVYDVERPAAAFALPSAAPTGPSGPGTAGHPQHFPGQAIVADVVATPDGWVAVGYVGQPWTAIGWTSQDALTWRLAPVDDAPGSFAVALARAADGTIVAVGRSGPRPAAWTSDDGRTWRAATVSLLGEGGDWERMTEVLATPDGLLAGGSAGPELGERHARFWSSEDGRSWAPLRDDPRFEGAEVTEIERVGDRFFVLARVGDGQRGTGTMAWSTTDGTSWDDAAGDSITDGLATAIAALPDGRIVAVGSDVDEREARVWIRNDAGTWERLPAEPSRLHFGQKIRMTDVVATPGGLVAVGNQVEVQFGTGLSWLSLDGRSWTKSPLQPSFGQAEPLALAADADLLVAVGSHGAPDNYVPTVWLTPVPRPSTGG